MCVGAIRAGLLLSLSLAAGAASAGSFSVSPVRVTLSKAEPIVALRVHNADAEPAVIQLEVMSWSQQDGTDRYDASRDLIATPPIFRVPAGGTQIVRVGLRGPSDSMRERAYRVYLQEVPAPPPAGFVGTRVALRLGVPVFVPPVGAPTRALTWQLLRGTDGAISLVGSNSGSVHARIVDVKLASSAATTRQTVAADLHAGQRAAYRLRPSEVPPPGTPLHLTVTTEQGDVHADLVAP